MGRRTAQPSGGRGTPRHEGSVRSTSAPSRKRFIDYPRAGRHRWTRWIPSWRLVGSICLLGIGALAVAFLAMYANAKVTGPKPITQAQTTIVYYSNGKTEIGRFQVENRTIVPLSSVPQPVRYAVLSAEDRTFYQNQGVSITGTLRAAWNNSQGGALQGGSTITQQYVKNAILNNQQRTVSRKLNEFFVALKISRQLSKDDILGNYLNTIYFGRNSYGIEAAAQTYFRKDISKTTPSEGAFLAGIINGPNLYDPANGPTATALAKERWTFVVDGMEKEGWITSAERAAMAFPTVQPPKTTGKAGADDQSSYLLQMVRTELVTNKHLFTDEQLDTGGLRIVTTFNPRLIADGVKAVRTALGKRADWPDGTQVAMASLDPTTGAVRAIYGGDGKRSQNAATQDEAQAGSTFKPFALIAGLEGSDQHEPFSLKSRFDGRSPMKFADYAKPVRNFGNEQFGRIDLVTATEHSVNTVYVGLNDEIGPGSTEQVAIRAGLPKGTRGLTGDISNVLGPSSPHPIDMASAYATIAAQGVQHPWYVVQQVRNSNGPIYTNHIKGTPVFSSDVMADTTYAMQQVVRRGTGSYAGNLGRPAAGKTGTSDLNKSAWFVGFTPQMATAVAMYRIGPDGGTESLKGFRGFSSSAMTGGGLPVRVWTEYMSQALDNQPVETFPAPAYGGVPVDPAPTQTATATQTPTQLPTQRPTTTPTPLPTSPTPTLPTPTLPTTVTTSPTSTRTFGVP